MRLKTLSLAMFTLGLTACASMPQSNTQSTSLDNAQQATTALNSFYTQSNYNFNMRLYSDLDYKAPETNRIQQNIIEQYIRNQNLPLSVEQKNALIASLDSNGSVISSRYQIFNTILDNIVNYGELQLNGGIDLRQKRANIELFSQYHDANLLVQYRFPALVDFNQSRIYVNDLNLKNVPSKAQKNHQAYYIDFSGQQPYLKSINWKNVLDYLKLANGIYFEHLIGQETIETLQPTAEERQQGAVKKLRLNSSVEEMYVENLIFDTINRTYVDKLINLDAFKKTDVKNKHEYEEAQEQAIDTLFTALNNHFNSLETQEDLAPSDETNDVIYKADDQLVAQTDTPSPFTKMNLEQCQTQTKNKATFGLITECYHLYDDMITDDSKHPTTLASWRQLFNDFFDYKVEIEKIFSQYDNGELKTLEQFKQIVQKHQADIQKFTAQRRLPITFDVSLDTQGRIVSNNIAIHLQGKSPNKQFKGTLNLDATIHNYGKAKIELFNQNIKDINEHPWMKEKKVPSWANLNDEIATSVYQKTKSYEKTYSAVFIAEFARQYPELIRYTTAQDLQEIALVYAYSYADEDYFKITPAQHKHIQALEKKHQLTSSHQMFNRLGADVAELVEITIDEYNPTASNKDEQPSDQQKIKNLKAKYTTPEKLFVHLYMQELDDTDIFTYTNDEEDAKILQEYKKRANETATILAKSYVALRENRFDASILKGLTPEHREWIYRSIYQETVETVEKAFPQKK